MMVTVVSPYHKYLDYEWSAFFPEILCTRDWVQINMQIRERNEEGLGEAKMQGNETHCTLGKETMLADVETEIL